MASTSSGSAAPWVEAYVPSSGLAFLSGIGGWLLPLLLFLLGVAVAGGILYVFIRRPELLPPPFFGHSLFSTPLGASDDKGFLRQTADALGPFVGTVARNPKALLCWGVLLAVSLLSLVLIIATFCSGTSESGGMAFKAAGAKLGTAAEEVTSAVGLVTGLDAASVKVLGDLDELYSRCPPAVEKMLGKSLAQAKVEVGTLKDESGLAMKVLEGLPEALWKASGQLGDFAGMIPFFAGLSILAALLCCGAVAVLLAETHSAWLSRYLARTLGPRALALLCPVAAALAAFLLCATAAAEVATASKASGFCSTDGGPDAAVLSSAEQSLGSESSTYGLARHYIAGEGNNLAILHIVLAKDALVSVISWLEKYRFPLQETCPSWAPGEVAAHLQSLHVALNQSEALLQPANLYSSYQVAVHEDACAIGTAGLGSLAMLQVVLGAVCLPLLVLSAEWLKDSLSAAGGAFERLGEDEKEAEKSRDHHGSDGEGGPEVEDFNKLYYVVYAFSGLTFFVGLFMYVFPQPGLVRPVVGTLLYAAGIFLLTNSDLVVTYVRMHEQVGLLKANNERFEKGLQNQAVEVRRLQTAAKGLDEIDRKFGGSVERAMKEIKQLQTAARANIGMSCKELCMIYFDKDKNRFIEASELDDALETLATIFGAIVSDLRRVRIPKLKQGVTGHPRFKADNGLSVQTFSDVFECALFAVDPAQIPQAVIQVLDSIASSQPSGKGAAASAV